MATAPGADEVRARRNLIRALDGGAPASARARDWFDDYVDATETKAPPPGSPPEPATAQAADDGEPRWDWRRLLSWPYARPAVGACVALIPWFGAYSLATKWGAVLTQARTEAGVGAAWVIATVGLTVGAVWVHRRRTWPAYTLLTCAFIGAVAMASPFDIIQFVTGVTR